MGDLIHSLILSSFFDTVVLGLIILGCTYIIISLTFNLYILYSSLIEEVIRLNVRKSEFKRNEGKWKGRFEMMA